MSFVDVDALVVEDADDKRGRGSPENSAALRGFGGCDEMPTRVMPLSVSRHRSSRPVFGRIERSGFPLAIRHRVEMIGRFRAASGEDELSCKAEPLGPADEG